MGRAGFWVRGHGWEVALAIAVAAMLVELPLAEPEYELNRGLVVLTAPLWLAPILLRRRIPLLAPVLPPLVILALHLSVGLTVADLAVPSFFVLVGTVWIAATTIPPWRSVLVGAASLAASSAYIGIDTGRASDVGFAALLGTVTFVAGTTLGVRERSEAQLADRAARLERIQREEADRAAAAERANVARELHDVIAQSVSVMTVQAGAARMLLDDDPQRALAPVAVVEETGREALAELRRLLGILRADTPEVARAPQPGLAAIDALLDRSRAEGLPVTLQVDGAPATLAPGIDLAAFRVIEDALDAARAEGPAAAQLTVRYPDDELELEFTSMGAASVIPDPPELMAARERIAVYGGRLSVERRADGGFGVLARLPRRA